MLTKIAAFVAALFAAFALSVAPASAHSPSTDTGTLVYDGSSLVAAFPWGQTPSGTAESLGFTATYSIPAGESAEVDVFCNGSFAGSTHVTSGVESYVLISPTTGSCWAGLVAVPLHGRKTLFASVAFTL